MSARPRSVDAFATLWFAEWGFDASGKPEDAACYLEGILRTIGSPKVTGREYVENIGSIDGQQQFIFQWLRMAALIERTADGSFCLTTKGNEVLRLLEAEAYYSVFDLDD